MTSAFVVGFTGETGKALVKELITRKRFQRLTLIGRKPVTSNFPSGVEVKVVNFDRLDEHKSVFSKFDLGFCCLGSSRSRHGAETFMKVDRDVTIRIAQLALSGGCKHYHLVSSARASGSSSNLYLQTKFLAEEGTVAAGFDRVSIYRPGLILCDRAERRPAERAVQALIKPIAWAFPTLLTTPVEVLAQAMVSRSLVDDSEPKGVVRLEIADIFRWAKRLPPLPRS